MSLKQKLADETIERLFGLMSSPHFMRLSNVFWRQVNEHQLAKLGPTADLQILVDRVEHLERRLEQLHAKMSALRAISPDEGGGRDGGEETS